ncbi:hypothetical protein AMS68_002778 [Peltaster fructicola]|uniref:Ribosomal protein S8 n=1 Tax=Peltaster fructicola TaxID=286661 RepID=A0A6H0XRH9_9PEZI|nr:hypothetical protein AMS68_002778 [Peltaster fructicola]
MSLVGLANVCSHLQNASLARLGLTSVPYTKLHLQISVLLQKQGFFSTVDLAGPTPPLSRFPPGTQGQQRALSAKGRDRESALVRLVKRREAIERERVRTGAQENPQLVSEQLVQYSDELLLKGYQQHDLEWARKNAHLSTEQLLAGSVEVEAMGLTVDGQQLDLAARTVDTIEEGIITQNNRASRRLWLGLKYWNGEPVLRKARMISKPTKRIWLDRHDMTRLVRGAQAGEVKGLARVGEIMAVSTDRGIMDVRECVERQIGGQPLARFW